MLRLSLRLKLMTVVIVNAVALLIIIFASSFLSSTTAQHLQSIRQEYLPKVGLRPQLTGRLERLQRGMQDAAAANDRESLSATRKLKDELLADVDAAHDAIGPGDALVLHHAVDDYFDSAHDVAKRMIAGETGEAVNSQMRVMQTKQNHVLELLDKVSAIDGGALSKAFDAAANAQATAAQIRLGISALCLLAILILSAWIGRSVVRNISQISAGFQRFGAGDFAVPISAGNGDELGQVAVLANQMADRLKQLDEQRQRVDWLKAGEAALAEHLLGELEPQEVADRSLAFLAHYLESPVAALYCLDASGQYTLAACHGLVAMAGSDTESVFEAGHGLLGEAVNQTEIAVVRAPPEGHLRLRSGVTDSPPSAIALVPLVHLGKVVGLFEFAVLHAWTAEASELMLAVRESVASRIEVARARAATHALLAETQAQAQRLAAQEDELRRANEALTSKASELQAKSEALAERNADLDAARLGLEQKAEELVAASAFKSQFLANMSHELRTPLNAVIGFAELLHSGDVKPDSPEHHDFLGEILDSGRHLLRLINDILDLSKVEAGKIELRPEVIDIPKFVGQAVTAMNSLALAKHIGIEIEIAPQVRTMTSDPGRLTQVLYNFLSNAVKFSPPGSTIWLRVKPEGFDALRFEVEDRGVGIAPEDVAKLFNPFVQLANGAGKEYQGTGLGLALTKRLAERLGGQTGVTSTKGVGSIFYAILPLACPGVEIQGTRLDLVAVKPTPANGQRVLVVEDDLKDQALLRQTLAEQGFEVRIAERVADAMRACEEERFAAITLDLLLPDGSGLEVLRRARQRGPNQTTPVIVVSVSHQEGLARGFGLSDYLVKPVDPLLLRRTLERAITPNTERDTVLIIDDDPSALRLMEAVVEQIGYEPLAFLDAAEAIAHAQRADLAAVVLDLIMPGMSGFDFLNALEAKGLLPPVPVIVWTNKDISRSELERLRHCVSGIIHKSETSGLRLTEKLRHYLPDRRQGQNPPEAAKLPPLA